MTTLYSKANVGNSGVSKLSNYDENLINTFSSSSEYDIVKVLKCGSQNEAIRSVLNDSHSKKVDWILVINEKQDEISRLRKESEQLKQKIFMLECNKTLNDLQPLLESFDKLGQKGFHC